jgi:hypothetical protein
MSAADDIRAFIAPLLPSWRVQFGRWQGATTTDRYAVLQPTGGLPAELVRRPSFRLMLIGAENEAASVASEAADAVIEAMRESSGALVFLQADEPVYWPTDDGRPVFEIAITAITT